MPETAKKLVNRVGLNIVGHPPGVWNAIFALIPSMLLSLPVSKKFRPAAFVRHRYMQARHVAAIAVPQTLTIP